MVVFQYEQKFLSLVVFASDMNLSQTIKPIVFEDTLNQWYKDLGTVKRLKIVRDIVDEVRTAKKDNVEAQKAREIQAHLKAKVKGKVKRKKPLCQDHGKTQGW